MQEYLQYENLLLLPFSVQKLCEQINLAIFDYAEDKKSRNAILEKCLNEITGALEEVETTILNKYFATRKSLSDKVIRRPTLWNIVIARNSFYHAVHLSND